MILVDFSSLIVASAMAQRQNATDIGLLRHMALNTIISVKKKYGAKYGDIILCCDSTNYWRKDIYHNYKGGRQETKDADDFDWELFFKHMEEIKVEIKEVFPYKMVQVDRCEADDIIGVLALEATEPTLIYSRDRDFIQCMRNPLVRIYFADKKAIEEPMTPNEVEYSIHAKICTGDKGDYVPNIFSDINSFANKIRQTPCTEKKIDQLFKEGYKALGTDVANRYIQNTSLISLEHIPESWKMAIRETVENTPVVGSRGKIFTYLTTKKLNQHGANFLKDIGDF